MGQVGLRVCVWVGLLAVPGVWAFGETRSWTALFDKANQSHAAGRYSEAEALYREALATASD